MRKTTDRDIKIGKMINHYRLDRGLSLQQLGERLPEKISHQQIQKYEAGKDRVSAARLLDIAVVLDVPITSLYHDPLEILSEELARALRKKFNN